LQKTLSISVPWPKLRARFHIGPFASCFSTHLNTDLVAWIMAYHVCRSAADIQCVCTVSARNPAVLLNHSTDLLSVVCRSWSWPDGLRGLH
jgi:hypothetical protein